MEQPTIAMEGYFASSQAMDLAKNLLVQPCNVFTDQQQYYYEYPNSTDYYLLTQTSQSYGNTQPVNTGIDESQFNFAVSNSQVYAPLYSGPYQSPQSIDNNSYSLESSVFLSPQQSAPSSVAQSPQTELQNEVLDLPLDEIFNSGDDIFSDELITDELLQVLNDVGCDDLFDKLQFADQTSNLDTESCSTLSDTSSITSSPKRKYSSDSSGCYSLDSFDISSKETKTPVKRARRSKPNKEEKAARKKDQNKKAASRYRNKKKNEVHSSEQTLEELESTRDQLAEQLKKLQTEFNVILPLAKAAFTFDPVRNQHLSQLLARVNGLL